MMLTGVDAHARGSTMELALVMRPAQFRRIHFNKLNSAAHLWSAEPSQFKDNWAFHTWWIECTKIVLKQVTSE